MQKEYSLQEITELVQQFDKRQLPKALWTHQAHLIVAVWYNWHLPFAEALTTVRVGIIRYNEAVGTSNTDNSGYHETLTVFWMRLTKRFLAYSQFSDIESACNTFLASEEALRRSPLRYYSEERIFSVSARQTWVDGNIQKVPTI